MVPFKNSDQRRQEEKMIRGWFQISNETLFEKFIDIYGHRLIFSCQLDVL